MIAQSAQRASSAAPWREGTSFLKSSSRYIGALTALVSCRMPENDQERRKRQNLLALALLAIIVLAGTLLFSRFIRNAAIMKCVTAGRQDCVERIVATPPQ
jgi:hypothetical protein